MEEFGFCPYCNWELPEGINREGVLRSKSNLDTSLKECNYVIKVGYDGISG